MYTTESTKALRRDIPVSEFFDTTVKLIRKVPEERFFRDFLFCRAEAKAGEMNMMIEESRYMERAVRLAQKGLGWVNPNPLVGAVIVKDGRIIGEGYHRKCGDLHAERNAIASLTESAAGAVMYVTDRKSVV